MRFLVLCFLVTSVSMSYAYEWATELEIKYRSTQEVQNDLRMLLEADELTDSVIVDSLKKSPKGGELEFTIPKHRLAFLEAKQLVVMVKDELGVTLASAMIESSQVIDADRYGWLLLLKLPIFKIAKKSMHVEIEYKEAQQLVEYPIDMYVPLESK